MTNVVSPDHHPDHRHLLLAPEAPLGHGRIDAIVVPTIRHPFALRHAMDLAIALACPLVMLCSGRYTGAAKVLPHVPPGLEFIAIDVTNVDRLALPSFETSRLLGTGIFARKTNTAAKRNLGLLLARRRGWKRIFFLDDDMRVESANDLSKAASLLDSYSAVSLGAGGFPDNSVVCHAYREIGGPQTSFVGGGALAVRLDEVSFFPDIYNEDWFYLLGEAGLRTLAVTGSVTQAPYDPYRTPERARGEELGDVLAEGIFWLLDEGRSPWEADERHWREFIQRRRRFVQHVLAHIHEVKGRPPDDERRMIAALKASLGRLEHIGPEFCVKFMDAWHSDLRQWIEHVSRMKPASSLEAALAGLTPSGQPRLPNVYRASEELPRASQELRRYLTELR